MPTFKSKAEERRYGERFGKQLAAMNAAAKREADIAVAESAVVKAAMEMYRRNYLERTPSLVAACEALAKLTEAG
jgi:hypothetical protein